MIANQIAVQNIGGRKLSIIHLHYRNLLSFLLRFDWLLLLAAVGEMKTEKQTAEKVIVSRDPLAKEKESWCRR